MSGHGAARPASLGPLVALRALGLGDLLTGLPALRALADAFPEHGRFLAAPAALAPLVGLSGCGFLVVPTRPLASLPRLLHRAEVAVNLHGRGPESHRVLLAARPRRLIGFSHPGVAETAGSPRWREDEHEVARWCRLLTESGIPADPRRLDLVPPRAVVPGVPPGAVLIHPGAGSPARRWPPQRWALVARAEVDAGRRVVLTGGPSERALATSVAKRAGLGEAAVLAGRTGLLQLAALVASAALVVCGDTGIAHLATALGVPSVVLFGPTSPARWGPPADRPQHRAIWKGTTRGPHGSRPDPGLLAIGVDEVLEAMESVSKWSGPAVTEADRRRGLVAREGAEMRT